ncbi:MAG: transporter substrate-binding domain-containing protein, partial [Oscillospiraceae bacterium]
IGILKDGTETAYLAKYAKDNNFTYTLMEYENNSEMRYALENKQVDIIASNDFISSDNYKTVGIYGVTPVYAIGKKDSPYIKELNNAVQKIKIDSPDFETSLYEKFYDKSVNFISSGLTRVETNYIAGLDTIRVGVYDHFAPLSFVDNNGTFQGVYIDILNQLSSISGISFEPVALSPSTDPSLVLSAEECDIIMGISSEVKFLYPTINLSRYFLTSEATVVGKINEEYGFDDDVTVALPRNFSGANTPVGKDYSTIKYDFMVSPKDCLMEVANGNAQMAVLNSYVANYHLKNPRFGSLQPKPTLSGANYECIAVPTSNPVLLSILNKSISILDPDEIGES